MYFLIYLPTLIPLIIKQMWVIPIWILCYIFIYLRLVDFDGINVGKYTSPMDVMEYVDLGEFITEQISKKHESLLWLRKGPPTVSCLCDHFLHFRGLVVVFVPRGFLILQSSLF